VTITNWHTVRSRRRTVRIVRIPSPSSREGTANSSQTRAGSGFLAAPRNANSMGSRELERILARARSECGSMSWARRRTPETCYLDSMRSKRGHLGISLRLTLRSRFALWWQFPSECYTPDPKKECHASHMSLVLKLSHRPIMSTGEENSGWNLTESGIWYLFPITRAHH